MKSLLLLPALSVSFILTISSCQKNYDPSTPETIDSIKSILPKQIILTKTYDETEIHVVSIKYDTLNRRIDLYYDDTTNTNPYDTLAYSYLYNSNGYLVSAKIEDDGYDIKRGPDNKIIWMTYEEAGYKKDTIFYNYESVAGGTQITTTERFINSGGSTYIDTVRYNYNASSLLIKVQLVNTVEDYTFDYNPNSSINKILLQGGTPNESQYFYSSDIPDDKEDLFCKLLIGNDYYLPELKELYPFQFYVNYDFDVYGISATNPYHISGMTDTHPDYGVAEEKGTLSYEYNEHKLLSKVIFNKDGQPDGMAIFKY